MSNSNLGGRTGKPIKYCKNNDFTRFHVKFQISCQIPAISEINENARMSSKSKKNHQNFTESIKKQRNLMQTIGQEWHPTKISRYQENSPEGIGIQPQSPEINENLIQSCGDHRFL